MIKESIVLISICFLFVSTNESPGFFLKISKNVPRIGRRSPKDLDEYFLKQAKNVPRIGRRNEYASSDFSNEYPPSELSPESQQQQRTGFYSKFLRPTRKIDYSKSKFYNNIRLFDSKHVTNQIADDLVRGSDLKFISWDDFDKALESDLDFFNKLHSMGKTQSLEDLMDLMGNDKKLSIVWMDDDQQDADNLFYRTDRSFNNNFVKVFGSTPATGLDLVMSNQKNKEKLNY